MALNFTEIHSRFRNNVARFVEADVIPQVKKQEKSGKFFHEWFDKCAKHGYFGVRYPKEFGGSNSGFVACSILCEEIARGSMSLALTVALQCLMGTDLVFKFGTNRHKDEILRAAINGEKVGAFALTEREAGSDLGAIRTTVKKEGSEYILNGDKTWITNHSVADFFVTLASRDPSLGTEAVDFYLVEKDTPGLSIGRDIRKLGTAGSICGDIAFRDCRIPVNNILGEEGSGLINLRELLSKARLLVSAMALGLSRAAFEKARDFTKTRTAFGRKIARNQSIRHVLAEMALDIHTSRELIYSAAAKIDRGECPIMENAMVKLFSTEAANRCADRAMRILASTGYDMDNPVQRYFRDARFLIIGGGTPELLKNIITREMEKGSTP